MLSEFQQKILWDAWLSAEIRAGYFALLVGSFQRKQRYLVLASLLLSSGGHVHLGYNCASSWLWLGQTIALCLCRNLQFLVSSCQERAASNGLFGSALPLEFSRDGV